MWVCWLNEHLHSVCLTAVLLALTVTCMRPTIRVWQTHQLTLVYVLRVAAVVAGFRPIFTITAINTGSVRTPIALATIAPGYKHYAEDPTPLNETAFFEEAHEPDFNMQCQLQTLGDASPDTFALTDRVAALDANLPVDQRGAGLTFLPAGATLTCTSTAAAFSDLSVALPGAIVFASMGGAYPGTPQFSTLSVQAVKQLLVAVDAGKCGSTAGKHKA